MGKRDLKKYLSGLDAEQISEQILELYDKFPEVKTYYDFVFNPKEDKILAGAKAKIKNEYFPVKSKRPKLRRSTAQRYIKHFLSLGVDAPGLADLMLFNIETAQRYTANREMRYTSFFKSMLNSYEQAVHFIMTNGLKADFSTRLKDILETSIRQKWENWSDFQNSFDSLE